MIVDDTESEYDYMKFYEETYHFKEMCLLQCPLITNELTKVEASGKEVIIVNKVDHICEIDSTRVNTDDMEVHIQAPIYNERMNIRNQVQLRAILEDKRNSIINPILAEYRWSSHLPENLTDSELFTSNKRVFQNYTEDNLKQAITIFNMNAFNYKSENDQMRIIVKAWDDTLKLFGFDIIELPEIDEANIKITIAEGGRQGEVVTSSTKLETMSTLNIDISDMQDADE
jgi:hypothetical protein